MDGKKIFDFFELARQENGRFVVKTDHVDEFNIIRGLAARGTLDSAPAWLLELTKFEDGKIKEVQYADNADFTQVWDDRLLAFTLDGTGAADGDSNFFMLPFRLFDDQGKPFALDNPLPIKPSGLNIAGRITEVNLDATSWTALPAAALANRNAIAVQNRNGLSINIRLNYDNAAPAGEGVLVEDGEDRFYDITDTIILYGRTDGGTVTVTVEELS